MYRHHQWSEHPAEDKTARRQTAALASLVVVLLLLVGGLFLVQHLRHAARIEDCLMAGRRSCDTIVTDRR